MVSFHVTEKDSLAGPKVSKITPKLSLPILFCAVERDEAVYIPKGDFVLEEDDLLFVLGEPRNISMFFKAIGRQNVKTKNAIIVGGGRITLYLADIIGKLGIHVKIIEKDAERAVELTESLPHSMVINGDGTDEELLVSEGISDTDAFISLTDKDEYNLLTALYAAQLGVPHSIAKINRISYNGIVRNLGVESIVSPADITADIIGRFVRALYNTIGSEFVAMYKIVGGKAEALQFSVNDEADFLNVKLKNLRLKPNVLIACIARKGSIIIPSGDDVLNRGDNVVIVANGESFYNLSDIFN
jgi:trk system potassium uptake protein TrkA